MLTARRVGTAPGTTTMRVAGLGIQCDPAPPSMGKWLAPDPTQAPPTYYNPYGTEPDMRGIAGLGIVMDPNNVNRSLPNVSSGGHWPSDAMYYTRGDWTLYPDTPLGEHPTDMQEGSSRCYTPVKSGWIWSKGALGDVVVAGMPDSQRKVLFWASILSTTAISIIAAANIYKLVKGTL